MIKLVASEASAVMLPLVPAGTMAAFAITLPSVEFKVETPGNPLPAGHTERKPRDWDGTTVKFNEYAVAVPGMEQPPERSGKSRLAKLAKAGGPKAPLFPCPVRVSTNRQG